MKKMNKEMPVQMTPSLMVGVNEERKRVEVHLRGELSSPEVNSQELAALYNLADDYKTIIWYINTPGGQFDTLSEILGICDLYDCVITVGAGNVMSAGFMLWCRGDVRVLQPTAICMIHRESYAPPYGKTANHLALAEFNNKVFAPLLDDLCDMLTPEQRKLAELTEVFISTDELIGNDSAISWSKFTQYDKAPISVVTHLEIHGKRYQDMGNNLLMSLEADDDGAIYASHAVVYDLPLEDLTEILVDSEESSEEAPEEINQLDFLPRSSKDAK